MEKNETNKKSTINVESLYATLALIISRKNNVKVSVKVSPVTATVVTG